MPPKPKFDKEEILNAAFDIARKNGIDAVKARDVGDALGCSSRPIFTFFIGMEDLNKCIAEKARLLFEEYLSVSDEYVPAFKMRGMQMIKFAQDEPHLFRLLFMSGGEETPFGELMRQRIRNFASDIAFIEMNYHIGYEEAENLFKALWLQSYGICSMIVNDRCRFTEQEIAGFLGSCFAGQLILLKNGSTEYTQRFPVKKGSEEAKKMTGIHPDTPDIESKTKIRL